MPHIKNSNNWTWRWRGNIHVGPEPSINDYATIHIRTFQREFRKTGADVDITSIDQKMSLTEGN